MALTSRHKVALNERAKSLFFGRKTDTAVWSWQRELSSHTRREVINAATSCGVIPWRFARPSRRHGWWWASNTRPREKRYVRRRAMNMYERRNDKIVCISARTSPLFPPPPPRQPYRSRERMRGGKAHVRRRNGRAISVDMRCLKTATIRRRQLEVFAFPPPPSPFSFSFCGATPRTKAPVEKAVITSPCGIMLLDFSSPSILGFVR